MADKSWKAYERRIALRMGGKRRGAYTGANGQGKTDILVTGYAVECKLLARPGFQDMLNAAEQAEKNAESPLDVPLAIVKRKGDLDTNALVVMRLNTFMDHFGPALPTEEQPLTYAQRSE